MAEYCEKVLDFSNFSFSFAGCGFLGVYHIGAMDCMEQHIPHILADARFAGASAGALMACCYICKVPLDAIVRRILMVSKEAYKHALGAFDPDLHVHSMLQDTLEQLLPHDAHVLCSGRLHISVSRLLSLNFLDMENMTRNDIISEFGTRDQLIQTLLCSCYVPLFSGTHNPILDREITMDGAFSNNLPRIDDNTILVCPLAGNNHICPDDPPPPFGTTVLKNNSLDISANNLWRLRDSFFLPPPENFIEYYHAGYTDALRFLTKMKLIRCPAHKEVTVTDWSGKDNEDCPDCGEYTTQANLHKAFSLDQEFQAMVEELKKINRRRIVTAFSMTEMMKLVVTAPFQALRLVPFVMKLSWSLLMNQKEVVKDLLQGGSTYEVLEEWLDVLTSRRALMRTVLFRGNALFLWKCLALISYAVDFVQGSRGWMWMEMYYVKAVEENKAARAIQKAQKEAERKRRASGKK
ncbi:patatin-like phospholipase domain-containing protein 4 [Babylonia areolata]|uniref:patatin-like phospholipase domain-containing protein 4 n=1 Tax=Babylonia areolata TaxID=304850 RepID=UPI003FD2682A